MCFRDLSQINFSKFDNDKDDLFNQYGLLSNNVKCEIDRFETWIQNILDKYFSIKTKFLSAKRIKMPWVNGEIIQLINKKHKLFSALKKGLVSYLKYKSYAQILKMLLVRLRVLYFKRKFESVKNDSGKMWKIIGDVIGKTLKKSYRPMVKFLQIKSFLPINSINTLIQYQLNLTLT